MADVKIRNKQTLSDEHFKLEKITFDIQKKDGSWETQEREVYDHGNAATALLYNREHRTIILTRQFRIPTFINGNSSGFLLETCAGLLEEGEHPDETMKREILEETGYEVDRVEKVYEGYTSAGSVTELLFFYIAPYKRGKKKEEGGGLEEEGEEIKVVEMPFDEAVLQLEQGKIRDVKTAFLLQYALLKNLL
jgi:nudix-type nucleoside diphosphatase (YffH/AdpP family)